MIPGRTPGAPPAPPGPAEPSWPGSLRAQEGRARRKCNRAVGPLLRRVSDARMGRGSGNPDAAQVPGGVGHTCTPHPSWRHPGALWRKLLERHCVDSDGHGQRSQGGSEPGLARVHGAEGRPGTRWAPIRLLPRLWPRGCRTPAELLALGFLNGPFPSPEVSGWGWRGCRASST